MGSLGVGAGLLYLKTGAFLDPVRKEPWFQGIERDFEARGLRGQEVLAVRRGAC